MCACGAGVLPYFAFDISHMSFALLLVHLNEWKRCHQLWKYKISQLPTECITTVIHRWQRLTCLPALVIMLIEFASVCACACVGVCGGVWRMSNHYHFSYLISIEIQLNVHHFAKCNFVALICVCIYVCR